MTSLPFYAILFAHMGQNFGYETLMTELPTYMKQVLRFSIKEVSFEIKLLHDFVLSEATQHAQLFISQTMWQTTNMVFFFCFAEWYLIRSSILGYVAVFDVYLGYRRLDDLLGTLQSHVNQKDHQQHRWANWRQESKWYQNGTYLNAIFVFFFLF